MNIDEQIEILEAYRDGKKIEKRDTWINGFKDTYSPVGKMHQFNFYQEAYRIAPEPELVPWNYPMELPSGLFFVRPKGNCTERYVAEMTMIWHRNYVTFFHGNEQRRKKLNYKELFEDYEYSTDGVIWKPCGKIK